MGPAATLRVAVVGAGTMGRIHAQSVLASPRAKLAGIVESDPGRRRMAEEFQAPGFAALGDLDRDQFDAVVIAVPTDSHSALTVAAAAMGKHVLVEKPMARSLEEARAMADAHRRAGTRLLVGQVVRYFPEYVQAREAVRRGDVGRPAVIRTFRGGPYPQGSGDWYGDTARSGGLFLDLLIHDLDFLAWTFGSPEEVSARIQTVDGRPRHAVALLQLPGRILAEMTGSWLYPRFHTRFEIAGSTGILTHHSLERATVLVEAAGGDRPAVAVPMSPSHRSPYQEEMDDFVGGILDERPFRVTVDDAVAAVRLALWADAAAAAGTSIQDAAFPGGAS